MAGGRKSPMVYDDEVIGFGLQVRDNGRDTFTLATSANVCSVFMNAQSGRAAFGQFWSLAASQLNVSEGSQAALEGGYQASDLDH